MNGLNRYTLEEALAAFDPVKLPLNGAKAAAVCLAVHVSDGIPAVWLTERSASLRAHPAQFALPGGRVDPAETPSQAALRELDEELGIVLGADRIVGELDDFRTKSGYVITPYVVWVGAESSAVVPNPAEVAVVHSVSFDELDVQLRFVDDPDVVEPVVQWPFRGIFVHAPTAAILHQFREVVLHNRSTRVAHFGQPLFAWK